MTEHEQCIGFLRAKNESPIELDPSRTALIIVDMQRYFTQRLFPFTDVFEKISPGVCSGYLRRVREVVIPSIQRLLAHFREHGSSIVFTRSAAKQKMAMICLVGSARLMKLA
jgi:nicotinamidase-related amidase